MFIYCFCQLSMLLLDQICNLFVFLIEPSYLAIGFLYAYNNLSYFFKINSYDFSDILESQH